MTDEQKQAEDAKLRWEWEQFRRAEEKSDEELNPNSQIEAEELTRRIRDKRTSGVV